MSHWLRSSLLIFVFDLMMLSAMILASSVSACCENVSWVAAWRKSTLDVLRPVKAILDARWERAPLEGTINDEVKYREKRGTSVITVA